MLGTAITSSVPPESISDPAAEDLEATATTVTMSDTTTTSPTKSASPPVVVPQEVASKSPEHEAPKDSNDTEFEDMRLEFEAMFQDMVTQLRLGPGDLDIVRRVCDFKARYEVFRVTEMVMNGTQKVIADIDEMSNELRSRKSLSADDTRHIISSVNKTELLGLAGDMSVHASKHRSSSGASSSSRGGGAAYGQGAIRAHTLISSLSSLEHPTVSAPSAKTPTAPTTATKTPTPIDKPMF